MLLAAGQPPKVVSDVLGHSTVVFTMDVYTSVAEELAESAASAIAAYVPRNGRTGAAESSTIIRGVPALCQLPVKVRLRRKQTPHPLGKVPDHLRRIGDLNPGGCHHPTALAVRRHRPD